MKKRLLILCICLAMLVCTIPVVASAATVAKGKCGSNLTYTLDSKGKLTISGTGAMYNYSRGSSPFSQFEISHSTKTVVVKKGVTTIGNDAFYWNDLTSISLPSTLKSIGNYAFSMCSDLISLTVPSGVTKIGERAFYLSESLVSVSLPNSVTKIGEDAFRACSALERIVVPPNVKLLDWTFSSCSNLDTIIFTGDAPKFEGFVFSDVVATVYYPANKSGWSSVRGNYDGIITWKSYTPASITKQPTSVKVASGKKATVSVKASGDSLKYAWYYKDPDKSSYSKSSVKTSTFSTKMKSAYNGRKVYCVITDKYGLTTKTKTVTLTMAAKPKITKQSASMTVARGKTATVSLKASGEGLTYKWYVKDKGKNSFSYTSSSKTNSYKLTMSDSLNGRQVYCVVKDKYGQSVKSKVVTLSAPKTKAKITKQPVSVTVANGATAKLSISATGSGLSYKWYFKDKDDTSFKLAKSFKGRTFTTKMTESQNGRKVYCIVTDKYGQTATTKTVTLTVKATITQQPTNVSAKMDSTVSIPVKAFGVGLKYNWYIKNPGATSFIKSSSTSKKYSFTMTSKYDGRQMYYVVTDKFGNSVKSKTITCKSKVAIVQQPTGSKVAINDTACVTVNATGKDLTYQWYVCEPGAVAFSKAASTTKDYSLVINTQTDGSKAYCVITDKYGNSVTTKTVSLSILKAAITKQPSNAYALLNETAQVSVTAVGIDLTYQWYVCQPGAATFEKSSVTEASYSCIMTDQTNGTKVYCVVTDTYGNTVTSKTVTIGKKTPLAITEQPTSQAVLVKAKATTSLTAVGDGLTYAWYYKDPGNASYKKSASLTGNTFSCTMTSGKNGRLVYCVVTDRYGDSVQTDTVVLNVRTPLKITKQPSNQTVSSGSYVTVSVSATGDGLTYRWYYGYPEGSSCSYGPVTDGTSSRHTFYVDAKMKVYCIVKDKYGDYVYSDTVTLSTYSSSSSGSSSSSSMLSYVTGSWTSTYMISNGSAFANSTWRMNIYSSGNAYLYATTKTYSGTLTYRYTSGSYYYYYFSGTETYVAYKPSSGELVLTIDSNYGVFFEK